MILLSAVLIIILGYLIGNGVIKLPTYNMSQVGDKERNLRDSSTAIMVIGGILLLIEIFSYISLNFNNTTALLVEVTLFALLLTVPMFYIRRHLKATSSKSYVLYICYTISFALFALLFFSLREPKITIEQNNLYISSVFSTNFPIAEIDSIWLSDKKLDVDKKLSGFDFGSYYRGKFIVTDRKQIHKLYINNHSLPLLNIALKDGEIIVITREDTRGVKELYKTLKAKINKG